MYPSPPCVFDSEKGGGVRCDVNLNQLQFRFLRWRANGRSGAARNIFLIHNSPPLPRFPNFETRDKKNVSFCSSVTGWRRCFFTFPFLHTYTPGPPMQVFAHLFEKKRLFFFSPSLFLAAGWYQATKRALVCKNGEWKSQKKRFWQILEWAISGEKNPNCADVAKKVQGCRISYLISGQFFFSLSRTNHTLLWRRGPHPNAISRLHQEEGGGGRQHTKAFAV